MSTTLLLDSDIIAYKFASANQKNFDFEGDGNIVSYVAPLQSALDEVTTYIEELVNKLEADRYIVCLSCDSKDNWRKKVLPSYKENRANVLKPELLAPIKEAMREMYECYERPTLEADDIMGILSTHPTLIPGKKIIVSEDKDMKTIPGWLFNPAKDEKPRKISEDDATRYHLLQTLTGDPTDNYKGCPGIGPKKAEQILEAQGHDWTKIVLAYEAKGLDADAALIQARVARICQWTDYDFKKKKVILWKP